MPLPTNLNLQGAAFLFQKKIQKDLIKNEKIFLNKISFNVSEYLKFRTGLTAQNFDILLGLLV